VKRFVTYLIVCFITIFGFCCCVDAARIQSGIEGVDDVSQLKSGYESGLKSITISSPNQAIEVYGKSVCSATSKNCTSQYQGLQPGEGVEEFLKKAIQCSGGETNINYQFNGSGGNDYKGSYSGTEDVTAYWTDVYYITCVTTSAGENNVSLGDSGNEGSVGNTNTQTTTKPYNSSTTEQSPDTGVETYYIVLILIAAVSYGFMLLVKKYNLFKSI